MRFADINKRFTEIVTEYLVKGYAINSASMGGSQGEVSKVDLTDGKRILRIMIDRFSEWGDYDLQGYDIIVGFAEEKIQPHSHSDWNTIWNNRLEVIHTERIYEVGESNSNYKFFGTREEALAAQKIRAKRYSARRRNSSPANIDNATQIARRYIQRTQGMRRISDSNLRVSHSHDSEGRGVYVIHYGAKSYRLK